MTNFVALNCFDSFIKKLKKRIQLYQPHELDMSIICVKLGKVVRAELVWKKTINDFLYLRPYYLVDWFCLIYGQVLSSRDHTGFCRPRIWYNLYAPLSMVTRFIILFSLLLLVVWIRRS